MSEFERMICNKWALECDFQDEHGCEMIGFSMADRMAGWLLGFEMAAGAAGEPEIQEHAAFLQFLWIYRCQVARTEAMA